MNPFKRCSDVDCPCSDRESPLMKGRAVLAGIVGWAWLVLVIVTVL